MMSISFIQPLLLNFTTTRDLLQSFEEVSAFAFENDKRFSLVPFAFVKRIMHRVIIPGSC